MKKKIIAGILCLAMIVGCIFTVDTLKDGRADAASKEIKGIWLAYCDFKDVGLYGKSESTFRSNIKKHFKKAKYYGTNTVFFHVRAFDDASWKSSKFKMSSFINPNGSYDPLEIVIEEAHKQNLELHAWFNPYRISHNYYWDPAKSSTTERIKDAVSEVMEYDVDGIHFDDYFYTAKKGYKTVGKKKAYKVGISAKKKRSNCNKMVKAINQLTHTKEGLQFGISPAGNWTNCMNMGADVKKWLSNTGYIDYVVPQIYWTDNWGSKGKTKMFSERLSLWKKNNTSNIPMYIGLALYRTGQKASDDKGWAKRKTNMRIQVKKLRKAGMEGYVLFSSADLNDKHAKTELYKLKGLVKPIKAKSIKFSKTSKKISMGVKSKNTLKWNPTNTNPKAVKYTSSNKDVAKVNSKGMVRGFKKGKAVIQAKTSNGKVAKYTVKVTTYKAKVKKTTVVRKEPKSNAKKVKKLKKGKKVTVKSVSPNGKWGKIKGNQWVLLKHLTKR